MGAADMLLLLAQLVAPPLQPGPARLPDPAPQQQPESNTPGNDDNDLQLAPENDSPAQSTPQDSNPGTSSGINTLPRISGDLPYSRSQLETLLRGCDAASDAESGLKRCAELLTGQLQQDGYVNSRVYTETAPAPGELTVVMGRLVESTKRPITTVSSPGAGAVSV